MAVAFQEHKTLLEITKKLVWGEVWRHVTSNKEASQMERYINGILPRKLKLFVIKIRTNLLWSRSKKWKHKTEVMATRKKNIDHEFDPSCPLCEGTPETGAAEDTWQHAIVECPHQAQERARLLQEVREKHREIIETRHIQDLLTKEWLTGKLDQIPSSKREAVARLQIDIWLMAKALWCQSRQQIRKTEDEEKRKQQAQERKEKEKKRRKEIEINNENLHRKRSRRTRL